MATDEFDPMYGDALPMGTRIGAVVLGGAIGQGAEGIVYLAEHKRLGRVVVKEFWPKQIASRSASGAVKESQPGWQDALRNGLKAFADNGRRLCALDPHPNIVRAHELIEIESETACYLVMQHAQGVALSSLLQSGTALEPKQVLGLAEALTSAAAHLHDNQLIHRDIAPDNVLVGADMAQAMLIDFNAAKDEVQQASQSVHGLVKAGYSPFEQYAASTNQLDRRSDIYGIAAVLIHAVTGERPPDAVGRMDLGPIAPDPLAGVMPDRYSPAFMAALSHGFALRAADRPESVAAWRQELGLDPPVGKIIPSRVPLPARAGNRPPSQKAEHRSLVFLGLAVALFMAGWIIFDQWNKRYGQVDVQATEGAANAYVDATDAAFNSYIAEGGSTSFADALPGEFATSSAAVSERPSNKAGSPSAAPREKQDTSFQPDSAPNEQILTPTPAPKPKMTVIKSDLGQIGTWKPSSTMRGQVLLGRWTVDYVNKQVCPSDYDQSASGQSSRAKLANMCTAGTLSQVKTLCRCTEYSSMNSDSGIGLNDPCEVVVTATCTQP